MSGGISAIKGFDYQATVTLDRLFSHFDNFVGSARARPEGLDDLDLSWTSGDGVECRRYEQIKKSRENAQGERAPKPWTLQDAMEDLFPQTLARLAGNGYGQVWIVGDEASAELEALVGAGGSAPEAAAFAYRKVLHALARAEILGRLPKGSDLRSQATLWRVSDASDDDPRGSFLGTLAGFPALLEGLGLKQLADRYLERAREIHEALPDVLSRLRIESLYGTEEAVTQRVQDRLVDRYGLAPSIVAATLFRNLRGFVSDIAKQPGRSFDREELEYELRCVWPQMLSVRDAPPLPERYVARQDLVDQLAGAGSGRTVEAIGVSGSGKTTLAAAAMHRAERGAHGRIALYVEVRAEDSLRDALIGVAFHMRRFGVPEPFGVAVEGSVSDLDAVARLARSFSATSRDMLLVMDLVQGRCSDAFARDLATFVGFMGSDACHLIVLAQESALRYLSALERDQHGVVRREIRGFRFEEFVQLVTQTHPDPDRSRLHDIYERVTAGRQAGLFARLAESLARAPSIEAMEEIASRSGEDMLPFAEQQRFTRVSGHARAAAERLVCFALPFTRKEAEVVFAEHNVGLAIRELSTLGLLRANDEQTFEMHETVRAGIEGMLARDVRMRAHAALAGWYGGHGLPAAQILHLRASGDEREADRVARETFLRGEAWGPLAALVTRRRLVSAGEVVATFGSAAQITERYHLGPTLQALGEPVPVEALWGLLRDQAGRFLADFSWASAIVDAILHVEPSRADDLVALALEAPDDGNARREGALAAIRMRLGRVGAAITGATVARFVEASIEVKLLLLPLMVQDGRRDALRPAFEFINSGHYDVEGLRRPTSSTLALRADERGDVVEILSSLPKAEPAMMLATGSTLLGNLGPLLWRQRPALRRHCVEIVRTGDVDPGALEAALRVLVFLADRDALASCETLATRGGRLGSFALLAPALLPQFVDLPGNEARLLDRSRTIQERMVALSILTAARADLGRIYGRLRASEGAGAAMAPWDFLFLQASMQAPFREAIPLLETHLRSEASNGAGVFASAIAKLGLLPEAASMLRQALAHAVPFVRQVAAVTLGQRRSRSALPALVAQYRAEGEEGLVVGLATAIVASGPPETACLDSDRPVSLALRLWQCVLATRLRDERAAGLLSATATDRSLHWQLRRAAINAAGRLPFECALAGIAPVVMREHMTLTVDDYDLSAHSSLSNLVLTEAEGMRRIFVRGRVEFIEFFGGIFEHLSRRSTNGLPTGEFLAGWLYDRLQHHGWPTRDEAPDLVLNELHVPLLQSAVLRALRNLGRPDLIGAEIPRANNVWLVLKCLIECRRAGPKDALLPGRLRELVAASAFEQEDVVSRVLAELEGARATEPSPHAQPVQSPPRTMDALGPRALSYVNAVRLLTEGDSEPAGEADAPWVLEDVTREQFEHLADLAAPANDRYRGTETYVPLVSFNRSGHSVTQRRSTWTGAVKPAAVALRPAIAAANVFGINIAWHEQLMEGVWASSYVPALLACLDARADAGRFYEELSLHPVVLLPNLCTAAVPRFSRHIDARIIPLIATYAASSTDELFETSCALTSLFEGPEIDAALRNLLRRWERSFHSQSLVVQQLENFSFWRGFSILTSHSRFGLIEDWPSSLISALRAKIPPFHRQSVVRVLERHPQSYIQVEALLFKAEDWLHFYETEIDRLDTAAERLFEQTTD